MATGPDDAPQHHVLRGVSMAGEGLALVNEAACWSLSDEQTRAALSEVTRLQAVVRAAYLKLLAESASRDVPHRAHQKATGSDGGTDGGSIGGAQPVAETCAWLADQHRLTAARVRSDLRAARVLDPVAGDLASLGRELAAGRVTPEHAGIGVRALAQIPVKTRVERRGEIDTALTRNARDFAPPAMEILARHLLDTIEPDRAKHFDALADQRREVYVVTDSTGMLIVRGQLEPAGGAVFKGMLDHLSAPHRGPVDAYGDGVGGTGQTEITVKDVRTPGQRRHDALIEMVRLASGNLDAGVRAGEPARVVVHTDTHQLAAITGGDGTAFVKAPGHRLPGCTLPQEIRPAAPRLDEATPSPSPGSATCEQTGPISPTTLGRLACDAIIDRILLDSNGAVLEMQTLGRLFTAAQRRALAARDGGCAFPGCDRPPSWCDAHHIVFWSRGGPTTVANGILLCGPHHTTIHLGQWTVVVRDGLPWFVPPPHLDPTRTPLRNALRDAVTRTRKHGQQLALDMPIDDDGPPGSG